MCAPPFLVVRDKSRPLDEAISPRDGGSGLGGLFGLGERLMARPRRPAAVFRIVSRRGATQIEIETFVEIWTSSE